MEDKSVHSTHAGEVNILDVWVISFTTRIGASLRTVKLSSKSLANIQFLRGIGVRKGAPRP